MPKAASKTVEVETPEVAPAPAKEAKPISSAQRLLSEILRGSLQDGDFKPLKWATRNGKTFGIGSKFGELAFEDGTIFESEERPVVEALVSKLKSVRPNDEIRLTIH